MGKCDYAHHLASAPTQGRLVRRGAVPRHMSARRSAAAVRLTSHIAEEALPVNRCTGGGGESCSRDTRLRGALSQPVQRHEVEHAALSLPSGAQPLGRDRLSHAVAGREPSPIGLPSHAIRVSAAQHHVSIRCQLRGNCSTPFARRRASPER